MVWGRLQRRATAAIDREDAICFGARAGETRKRSASIRQLACRMHDKRQCASCSTRASIGIASNLPLALSARDRRKKQSACEHQVTPSPIASLFLFLTSSLHSTRSALCGSRVASPTTAGRQAAAVHVQNWSQPVGIVSDD